MNRYAFHMVNENETEQLGRKLGEKLEAGSFVLLNGDLGAGKTHFTKGIARALDIDEYITSPTFTIVNEYTSGRLPLFHFDAYRLSDESELYDIGFDDYVNRDGIIVVEWAENVKNCFPENAVCVNIMRNDGVSPTDRTVIIESEEKLF